MKNFKEQLAEILDRHTGEWKAGHNHLILEQVMSALAEAMPEKYDFGEEVFDGVGENRVSLGYVITETNDATRDDFVMAERKAFNQAIDQLRNNLGV